jgi:hypothetical protein
MTCDISKEPVKKNCDTDSNYCVGSYVCHHSVKPETVKDDNFCSSLQMIATVRKVSSAVAACPVLTIGPNVPPAGAVEFEAQAEDRQILSSTAGSEPLGKFSTLLYFSGLPGVLVAPI